LRRVGKKQRAIYKIVAADSRASRNGKFLESIGQYDPNLHPAVISVKEDRLFMWLGRGAQPTDTTRSLLQRTGHWLKWSLKKKGADDATIAASMEKWTMMQAEKLRREADKKARRKAAKRKKAAAEAPPAPAAPVAEAAPAPAAEAAKAGETAEAPAA
jgi:small subunit ribosomal protein S16